MKIIYDKIDQEMVNEMPTVLFQGPVVVVTSESEARKAVDTLLSQNLIGIDTETRPSFKHGCLNKVALLQVATENTCFLFRLNYLGLSPSIRHLLEDTTVPKIGLSLRDDMLGLHRLGQFDAGLFIDLQKLVGDIGVKDMSLQKLYANFFHKKISKRQRLTNWEAGVLTENQKRYAATDAWTCIQLYKELMSLEKTGNYKLVITETSETAQKTETSDDTNHEQAHHS